MQGLAAASQLRLPIQLLDAMPSLLISQQFESHNLQHERLAARTSGQAVHQCLSERPGRAERMRVGF
jgi:hypothetical protein